MTAAPAGKEWFTAPQAARILAVHPQTIYDAVRKGRLEARGVGRERRIHAREIIRYGVTTGRNGENIIKAMEKESGEIDRDKALFWALAAIGLAFLLGGKK